MLLLFGILISICLTLGCKLFIRDLHLGKEGGKGRVKSLVAVKTPQTAANPAGGSGIPKQCLSELSCPGRNLGL